MPQSTTDKDFQPLPTYTQTSTQNSSWINVTLTTDHSDGSRTQVSYIAKK